MSLHLSAKPAAPGPWGQHHSSKYKSSFEPERSVFIPVHQISLKTSKDSVSFSYFLYFPSFLVGIPQCHPSAECQSVPFDCGLWEEFLSSLL